ncbi:MAG: ABC transporter permease [Planctomycetota bacterium]
MRTDRGRSGGRATLRRIARALPALVLVFALDFLLLHLPGHAVGPDPESTAAFDAEALQRHLRETERRFHLDRPTGERFLIWARAAVRFDFGIAMSDPRPVRSIVAEALGPTLLLQGCALLVMFGLGVPLGVAMARRARRPVDRLLRGGLYGLQAVPDFWLATLLLVFLATGAGVAIFPLERLSGRDHESLALLPALLDRLRHLALPVTALALPGMAVVARQTRAAMLEAIESEPVLALRARGVAERRVVWIYALRSALGPVVVLFGAALPALVGGSVVVERIFNIRGLGLLLWEATTRRDFPILQALLLLVATAVVLGLAVADALAARLDPRVRT